MASELLAHGISLLRAENHESAVAVFDEIISADPGNPDALNNRGISLVKLKRSDEALECFQLALNSRPDSIEIVKNIALIFIELGKNEDALDTVEQALKIHCRDSALWCQRGQLLCKLKRTDESFACFERALDIDPRHMDALCRYGEVLMQERLHGRAEEILRRALAVRPGYPPLLNNLGAAAHEQGKHQEALSLFEDALAAAPKFADALRNRAVTLRVLDRYEEALNALDLALEINPEYVDALVDKAGILFSSKRFDESFRCYQRALSLKPESHGILCNYGIALRELGHLVEAEQSFRQALSICPESFSAYNALGVVLKDFGRLEDSKACFERAVAIKADFHEAHSNLGNALRDLGRVPEAEKCYLRAMSIKPEYAHAYSNLLFLISYHGLGSPEQYIERAKAWETTTIPADVRASAKAKTFRREPIKNRKLKVGYLSGDFRSHAVAFFIKSIFKHHDRQRIELAAYNTNAFQDSITDEIRGHVDQWHSIAGLSDNLAVKLIEDNGIDVLVDLAGHTQWNRLGVLARRAAPVQCHYLGYCASTGLSEIDYYLGDSILIPPHCDAHYSENVWRLPKIWVSYEAPFDAPAPELYADDSGRVCLGSFNSLTKITPETIDLWAMVLQRIPNACLMVKALELGEFQNRNRITSEFARRGISDTRIELVGRTPDWKSHMALYNKIHIALDPVRGVGGGTTTCDTLWMGVPVITMSGRRQAERMTESMLAAIGRRDWVARDTEDYINIVAGLAGNINHVAEVRQSLRRTMAQSALCDSKGLARALEEAYGSMYDRWANKQ